MVTRASVTEQRAVAEHYGSGLDMSTEADSLPMEAVQIAENTRLTPKGKLRGRDGYEEKSDEGLDKPVEDIYTMKELGVMFKKVHTAIYQSVDGETWYNIGVTRTQGAETIWSYNNFVFVDNPTDGMTKIVVSKLAENLVTTDSDVDVLSGEGFLFSSSGVIYVDGDDINYASVGTDTLQTLTNISADHDSGAIVTHTVVLASAAKGYTMAELDSKMLVAGKKGYEEVIYYSATSNDADPTLIHDFTGNDSNAKRMPSHVTVLANGGGIVLVGMKQGIHFAHSFDITTGGLLTREITTEHGILNEDCVIYVNGIFYCITNTNRILTIAANNGAAELLEPTDPREKPFDYGIQPVLKDMGETQNGAHAHYDPAKQWMIFNVVSNGVLKGCVYDMRVGAWAGVDRDKPFGCRTFFNGRTYAGDRYDSKVYIEDEGKSDNGAKIQWKIRTRKYVSDDGRDAIDALEWFFSGGLSSSGEFNLKIILDGDYARPAVDKNITAEELREQGLLDDVDLDAVPEVGDPIVPDFAQDVKNYDYPLTMLHSAKSYEFELMNNKEGTWFSLDESRFEYQTVNEHLLTSQ